MKKRMSKRRIKAKLNQKLKRMFYFEHINIKNVKDDYFGSYGVSMPFGDAR